MPISTTADGNAPTTTAPATKTRGNAAVKRPSRSAGTNRLSTQHVDTPLSLSPVTRSPSPLPKRPRHSSSDAASDEARRSVDGDDELSSTDVDMSASDMRRHALSVLVERDVDHAIRVHKHLDGTAVTPAMREQVVGWCADLVDELGFTHGVTALAVNLFDRFLIVRTVSTRVLHALTAACFHIAVKFVVDAVSCMSLVARRACVSEHDMLVMESVVLNVLEWKVAVVTAHEVVAQIQACAGDDYEKGDGREAFIGTMYEALLMHATMDYGVAWMRATSVGLACMIMAEAARGGAVVPKEDLDFRNGQLYRLGVTCGVDMAQVDECVDCLVGAVNMLLEHSVEEVEED